MHRSRLTADRFGCKLALSSIRLEHLDLVVALQHHLVDAPLPWPRAAVLDELGAIALQDGDLRLFLEYG